MARIAGVDLPRAKRMEIALTYVYGIGRSTSRDILKAAGVSLDLRSDDLSDDDVAKIRQVLDQSYKVEGDLRREVTGNIKRHSGYGIVPWSAPPQEFAGAWPAHPYQRAHS